MSNTVTNKAGKTFTAAETKHAIENHKTAATHLEKAKNSHLEAIKHHEADEHEKAKKSTVTAQEQLKLAQTAHHAVAKQHDLTN